MPSSERRARRIQIGYAGIAILVAMGVLVGFMLNGKSTDTSFVIAAGVLGSLIASALMLLVIEIVTGPSRDEAAAAADRLDEALRASRDEAAAAADRLDEALGAIPIVVQASEYGIRALKPKDDYTAEEWKAVLHDAREKLILVGHTLDKWCAEDIRPLFEETIERLAREGKEIQLLTLPLEGANIARISMQRNKNYRHRVQFTHEVVRAVYTRLPRNARARLSVRTLAGEVDMPYMLVASERVLVTCSYPTTAQSSGAMLTMTANPTKPFGSALRDDVRQILNRHSTVVELLPSPTTADSSRSRRTLP